jgi:hypothetical protein
MTGETSEGGRRVRVVPRPGPGPRPAGVAPPHAGPPHAGPLTRLAHRTAAERHGRGAEADATAHRNSESTDTLIRRRATASLPTP